jgi:hypothetical protein
MSKTWLETIQEGTRELESPKQYYYWSALAALAAVAKRNVYLNQFRFFLYPNIYVFLIGPSGIRKGPPVNLATKLVSAVANTRVITGRSSIEGITKEMGTSRTSEGGHIIDGASAFVSAGEFASSLVDNAQALTILTDLYDAHYHQKWKNTLVGREGEVLDRPYLVLLGASNQVHLNEIIKTKDIQGGFIARTFIINATKKNSKNSLVRKPNIDLDEAPLIEYLKEVARLRGEFVWKDGADDLYDEWYNSFDDQKEDITGTRARIHTSVLKVAMLLSLSKRLDLTITPDEINEALNACNNLIKDMNQVFMPGKGTETELGKKISIMLTDLVNAPEYKVSRQQLMSRHWGVLDAFSIDQVVETLQQPGLIRIISHGTKAAYTFYQLTEVGLESIRSIETSLTESC